MRHDVERALEGGTPPDNAGALRLSERFSEGR